MLDTFSPNIFFYWRVPSVISYPDIILQNCLIVLRAHSSGNNMPDAELCGGFCHTPLGRNLNNPHQRNVNKKDRDSNYENDGKGTSNEGWMVTVVAGSSETHSLVEYRSQFIHF